MANPLTEIEFWREGVDVWANRCPCTCMACNTLAEKIQEATKKFPQQYNRDFGENKER